MKFRKILGKAIAMIMLLSVLTACGADSTKTDPEPTVAADTTAATTTAEPAEPVKELSGEITFWHSFAQGPRMENLQASADSFTKQHPGVKINIEIFSWGDFYTKWTTGLASGNVPDISTALPGHVAEMIYAEAIIALDDLIDTIGRERFYEAPLTEMTVDGSCYAVPLYSHAQVMWYRKDLLEKYKLEIPTTWDELYNAAVTISKGEDGKVYGCSVPMGIGDLMGARYLNFYVRSAGETLVTKDRKANLTSKAVIDGINYWVKMYKECSPSESINYKVLDQATLYYQGKNAFDFNSGFHISGVQANTPALMDYIDCAPMPTINKGEPQTGYETSNIPMVVWKNSKHPEVCKAFIEYLYQPENYVPFLLSVPVGMLPAIKDVVDDEKFNSDDTVKKFNNALNVISSAVGYGTAIGMEYGPCVEAGLVTSQGVIESMFQEIILNGTPVEKAAKAAEDRLNELFEDARS